MFGFLGRMDQMRFAFDQRPFEALFGSVHVKAFAVLPCGVEEESPNVRRDVGVFDLDMARLDGVGVAGFLS